MKRLGLIVIPFASFLLCVLMISLFVLRVKEPALERPFASPFYPVFPAIALVISAVTLFAVIYFNFTLCLYFFGGLGLVTVIFIGMGKHKVKLEEEDMIAPIFIE